MSTVPRPIKFTDIRIGMRVRAFYDLGSDSSITCEGFVSAINENGTLFWLGEEKRCPVQWLCTFTLLEEPAPTRADGIYRVDIDGGTAYREVRDGKWISADGRVASEYANSSWDAANPKPIRTVPEGHVTIDQQSAACALDACDTYNYPKSADVIRAAIRVALDGDAS